MADTKVTYDISDAISKLNQLNKKLGETADQTIKTFSDQSTRALDGFVDHLSDISPAAGGAVTKMRALVATFGPAGAVAATAAAGIGAVVSNLIDLPALLADSAAGMEAFNKAVDRQFRVGELGGDIQDAIIQAETKRELRGLRLESADIRAEQVRLSDLKAAANQELEIARNVLREKEALLRQSVNRRKAMEEDLRDVANERRVREVEGGATTRGRAVTDLAAAAQTAALEGNKDLAQQLLERAQQVTDELGGHAFFQKQVDQAAGAVVNSLEKELQAQKNNEATLENQVRLARQKAEESERAVRAITEEQRILGNRRRQVQEQGTRVRERGEQERQTDRADEAAGQFNAAITKIRREFEAGGRTVSENIKDSLRLGISALGSKARTDAGVSTEADALRIVSDISKVLLKPDATAQDVQNIQPLIERFNALLGALEVAQREGTLSAGQTRGVQQLERFQQSIEQAQRGAIGFLEADRSETEAIRRGSAPDESVIKFGERVNGSAQSLQTFSDSVTTATDRLNRLTSIQPTAAPAVQLQQGPTPTAAAVPGAAPPPAQNITVNATVKGGIIDREVTQTITDIIQRELRKQTATAPA